MTTIPPLPPATKPTTEELANLYPEIYKGNRITCDSREPDFDRVEYITLAQSEVRLNFVYEPVGKYYCDLIRGRLYLNSNLILKKDLSSTEAGKLKLLRACLPAKLLQSNYSPVVIQERPERVPGNGDVDSDDGVEYTDRAVINPFNSLDFDYFQRRLKSLYYRYHGAKRASFQNAQGKFFFTLFTAILALDHVEMDFLHSTNPSGDSQPRAFEVSWILNIPTTGSNTQESQRSERQQLRVADFVAWDFERNIYTIVGEIKSDNRAPVFFQSLEQMLGLFKKQQKVMLGLVCQPSFVTPVIVRQTDSHIIVTPLQKLDFTNNISNMIELTELLISFVNF